MDLKLGEDLSLRMTATTKVANEYGCSTRYSRNVTETVVRWERDVREYEQRIGKTLDEDVKIGVIPLRQK